MIPTQTIPFVIIDTTYRCCAHYGQGSGAIHLDSVFCRGTEASLLECGYSSPSSLYDSHIEDVGVTCPTCMCRFWNLMTTFDKTAQMYILKSLALT